MKRLLIILSFIAAFSLKAGADTGEKPKNEFFSGFDGGMMLHTGYLYGEMAPVGYKASGAPLGLGGVIRMHFGKHWRLGGEGYVSYLNQMNNGSYVKFGWGGVIGDFYWTFGRFIPYVGVMIGGGSRKTLLIMEEVTAPWQKLGESYYDNTGFFAVNPNIGCEYIVSKKFHLSLKFDWLCAISDGSLLNPTGPRSCIGFIFFH